MISSIGGSSTWGASDFTVGSASQRQKAMFDRLDADGDGKITKAELKAAIPAGGKGPSVDDIMSQADTNGDGAIDESENDAFLSKMDARGKAGAPSGPPPQGGGGTSDAGKIFDKLDTNHDGKVSIAELLAAKPNGASESDAQQFLKEVDTNGDGTIDKNENDAFFKKMDDLRKSVMQQGSVYNDRGKQQADIVGSVVNAVA